ncbi:MAG: hypothetical protein PVH79_02510 [Candidatus Bathyarchaeota archaeon]|jgi:hypothetical protein
MVLEILESYIIGGFVGFLAGLVAARFYFRSRMSVRSIGQLIEYSLIENEISRLGSLAVLLERLVKDIRECSGEITEKLEISSDIEEDILRQRS